MKNVYIRKILKAALPAVSLALGLILIAGHGSLHAEEMRGRVTRVQDGDTLQFQHRGKSLRVRLIGIDAPEKGQPFANEARRALESMVKNREVRLVSTGRDQYGRVLAGVFVGKLAVQNELLKRGLVWVYPTYRKNQKLMGLERRARRAKVGIWSHKNPTSPWDYKRRKRKKTAHNQDHSGNDHAGHDHSDHDHNKAGDCMSGGKPAKKPAPAATAKPGPPAGSGGCPIN